MDKAIYMHVHVVVSKVGVKGVVSVMHCLLAGMSHYTRQGNIKVWYDNYTETTRHSQLKVVFKMYIYIPN